MNKENQICIDYITGEANITKTYTVKCDSIVIANDGPSDVVVVLNNSSNLTITLKPGRIFDENVNPFNSFTVTATTPFTIYVRDNQNN